MTPLRQRMREDMQVRNLSPHTQRAYVDTVARFARHVGRSPALLEAEEIRAYLVYLTTEKQLAPSSVVIAVCALRFLCKVTLKRTWSCDAVIPAPKKPVILPVVLSPEEVVHFLACVTHPAHRTILTTCYATGLRTSEAVRLTIPAVDSQRMVLRVDDGKGQQDRDVMLSPTLLAILRDWWRVHRPTHWFFRGEDPERPLTSHAVREACQRVHRRSRIPNAHHTPFCEYEAPVRQWTMRHSRDVAQACAAAAAASSPIDSASHRTWRPPCNIRIQLVTIRWRTSFSAAYRPGAPYAPTCLRTDADGHDRDRGSASAFETISSQAEEERPWSGVYSYAGLSRSSSSGSRCRVPPRLKSRPARLPVPSKTNRACRFRAPR